MHFFTPVEVVKVHSNTYSCEQLLRFGQDFLLEITEPRIRSLADERKQLITWLKTISPLDRQLAAALYNPEFVCLARKMYQEWQIRDEAIQYGFCIENQQYSIRRQRVYRSNRQKQAVLLKEVVLVSRGQLYEGITLSETLLTDLEAFFNLMDELQGGVMLEFSEIRAEELKSGKILLELQMEEEGKSVGEWISKMLVKQIYLSFQTRFQRQDSTANQLKVQEREYGQLWKELDADARRQIVSRSLQKRREEVLENYMYGVGVLMSDLPSVYIQTDEESKVESIVACHPKELIYKLVFTPIGESLDLLNLYNIEIVLEIEAELSNRKERQKPKKPKRKKKVSQENSKVQMQKQQVILTVKRIEVQTESLPNINEGNRVQKQDRQETAQTFPILDNNPNNTVSYQEICSSKEESEGITYDSDNEQKASDPKQQPTHHWELQDYYKGIKVKCVQKDKCRKIILNRLIVILASFNFTCKVFGSFAYQLTVPDSDLDVLVDSGILNCFVGGFSQRQQIINSLLYLQTLLQSHAWTSDFVFLHAAKIPLLKLKANAGLYFEHTKPMKLRVNGKKQKLGDATVQVDLTIQPLADFQQISHFGIDSTQQIKSWIETYPLIKQLIIVFKSMVREKGLHVSYEGGISSYAIILLLVAFVRSSNNISINKAVSQLATFLRSFNEELWLIDIRQPIPLVKKKQQNSPVLINPFDGRDLLERSFRFIQIVELIENWKDFCKQ